MKNFEQYLKNQNINISECGGNLYETQLYYGNGMMNPEECSIYIPQNQVQQVPCGCGKTSYSPREYSKRGWIANNDCITVTRQSDCNTSVFPKGNCGNVMLHLHNVHVQKDMFHMIKSLKKITKELLNEL